MKIKLIIIFCLLSFIGSSQIDNRESITYSLELADSAHYMVLTDTAGMQHYVHMDSVNSLMDLDIWQTESGNKPTIDSPVVHDGWVGIGNRASQTFGVSMARDNYFRSVFGGVVSAQYGIDVTLWTNPDSFDQGASQWQQQGIHLDVSEHDNFLVGDVIDSQIGIIMGTGIDRGSGTIGKAQGVAIKCDLDGDSNSEITDYYGVRIYEQGSTTDVTNKYGFVSETNGTNWFGGGVKINLDNPTSESTSNYALHVQDNVSDPVRIVGLNSASDTLIVTTDGDGVLHYTHIDSVGGSGGADGVLSSIIHNPITGVQKFNLSTGDSVLFDLTTVGVGVFADDGTYLTNADLLTDGDGIVIEGDSINLGGKFYNNRVIDVDGHKLTLRTDEPYQTFIEFDDNSGALGASIFNYDYGADNFNWTVAENWVGTNDLIILSTTFDGLWFGGSAPNHIYFDELPADDGQNYLLTYENNNGEVKYIHIDSISAGAGGSDGNDFLTAVDHINDSLVFRVQNQSDPFIDLDSIGLSEFTNDLDIGKSFQVSNDGGQNVNSSTSYVNVTDWSSAAEFNDDTDIFEWSGDTLYVHHTGRIEARVNLWMTSTGQRVGPIGSLFKNGVRVGPAVASYIRNYSSHDNDSMELIHEMEVTSGDFIQFRTKRGTSIAASTTLSAGTSFMNVKITK